MALRESLTINEIAALQKEVARLRGLIATILKTLPQDHHAHRARLLNTLSELKIFERAFVDTAPLFPIPREDLGEPRHTGRLFAVSVDQLKERLSELAHECRDLRRALNTEQHCHRNTLAEITIAWNELVTILDREEHKAATLSAEREELQSTLLGQGLGISETQKECDDLASALQDSKTTISRLETERDALSATLEAERVRASDDARSYEDRLAALESERASISKSLLKQTVDASAAAARAKRDHKSVAAQMRAARAEHEKAQAERDQLSSTLELVKQEMSGIEQALELSKKLVSHQNTTIEKHIKKQKELESSLAVAGILKQQLNNDVKHLTERCNTLSTTLEALKTEKTTLAKDLTEAQQQLAEERFTVGDLRARLLVERKKSSILEARIADVPQGNALPVVGQNVELSKARAERDYFAQREQDATNALAKETRAREKAEKERSAMVAEMNILKAMLVDFSGLAHQSTSQERLRLASRDSMTSVFGPGTSVNIPRSPSSSSSKARSRFGSLSRAASNLNVS